MILLEPPIITVVRGEPFADRDPGRVVIGAARECEEAEGAEQEGQDQGIARIRLEMLGRKCQGSMGLPLDCERQDFNVLVLAPRGLRSTAPGRRYRRQRLRALEIHGMDACTG